MAVKEKEAATKLELDQKGIARLIIDTPGSRFNVIGPDVFREINDRIEEVAANSDVRALLILSGKADNFVAGADIKTLATITTIEEGRELSAQAQSVFDNLENLSVPKLCAIHGVCLGGGLEMALATDYRLISEDSSTALALPEVQIGLIPGAGGTQRLPRLIGLPDALDMILTGRKIRPHKARKIGLADEVVPVEILEQRAMEAAAELTEKKGMAWDLFDGRQKNLASQVAEYFGVRSAVFSKAKSDLKAKTDGHYPAPFKALDAVKAAVRKSLSEGLKVEAQMFGEAAASPECKALMNIFNGTTSLKSDSGLPKKSKAKPKTIKRPAVLGGGLMGSGIATVLADVGYTVRVKDISKETLGKTLKYAYKVFDKKVERKHYRAFDRDLRMSRVSPTTSYQGFEKADIVIEAVFEDIKLKHRVLAEVEQAGSDDTIFATNTSSLPIGEIAAKAERPENVIGMHFFSPVEKMQLVEVIVTPKTADWVTATTVKLAKDMKKHVIVVGDGAGFYTSRVLAGFCAEAVRLLYDGARIDDIDKAINALGFPVGPMILMDEVGIGVVSKVMKIMKDAFPGRFEAPEGWEDLIGGREGKKSGKGFYVYHGKNKEPDTALYQSLSQKRRTFSPEEIQQRCLFAFLNEAALCLEEEILRNPRDGDIGAIFGLGFPPFKGGPFHYMDHLGAAEVVETLNKLRAAHGDFFTPAKILETMASKEERFY